MAIYRKGFGALGDAFSEMILAQAAAMNAPHVAWSSLIPNETGGFYAEGYGWGTQETPGIVVFRTDAGSVTAISIQSESASAEERNYQLLLDAANLVNAQQMTEAPRYQAAWLSGDPAFAIYWERYGAWPVDDPAAQSDWFRRAWIGGALEANEQDRLDSESGWEGFFNNVFPMLASSFVVGGAIGAWAAATGAPAYGPVAAASDLIQTELPDLYAAITDAVTPVADVSEAADVIADSTSGYGYGSPESLVDPVTGTTDWISASAGSVPVDSSSGYGYGSPESLVDPVTGTTDWISAAQNLPVIETASEEIPRVTITGQQPPPDETVWDSSQFVPTPSDSGPMPTPSAGTTFMDVVKTAGAVIPVIGAGAGLIRTLTASDAPLNVPYLPGTSAPGTLPGTTQPPGASGFPWWVLIAGAMALSGN